PINKDSGNTSSAKIQGGRKFVRNALYMACMSAIRFNDEIKRFYHNLRSRHKSFKVAITACMHKLIIHLNTLLRCY
ncbi:MAG: transposase, partial [Elusimicrobiota bacterium]|nr:transposase [Elusimicrobiota bacterium]